MRSLSTSIAHPMRSLSTSSTSPPWPPVRTWRECARKALLVQFKDYERSVKQKSRHFSPLVEWLANVVASERPDAAPHTELVTELLAEWGRNRASLREINYKYPLGLGPALLLGSAADRARHSESSASRIPIYRIPAADSCSDSCARAHTLPSRPAQSSTKRGTLPLRRPSLRS